MQSAGYVPRTLLVTVEDTAGFSCDLTSSAVRVAITLNFGTSRPPRPDIKVLKTSSGNCDCCTREPRLDEPTGGSQGAWRSKHSWVGNLGDERLQ